jgi:MYXO-CTERM domain-containing protein
MTTGAPLPWWIAGALALAVVVLLLVLQRRRGEIHRLHRALHSSSQDLERLQLSFARFAPQEIIERIIAKGVSTTADRKEVTVLFADLVGFTRLSEGLDPAILVEILNGYFTRMSRVISEHRGHVSKFIGDGLLAFFGVLERNPWQVNDAVEAALVMQAELREYNERLKSRGLPELRAGMGIHRGIVVAGVIGSNELMEFTVIGNTVNVASRVEHLTRVHDAAVLVTDAVREVLDQRFRLRELPPTQVAGVSEPLVVYAVDGVD